MPKVSLHPKSRTVVLKTFLAVNESEERRLRAIIESEQTSPPERSQALDDLSKLWRRMLRSLADFYNDQSTG
jgi:hypothetical protein